MKNIFNKLTNTKQKKIIFSIISVFLIILICFSLSKTNFVRNLLKLAGIYTQEEKVIEFYSDGWEENEPGSVHVTKSADWIGEDTAEITFDIESKIKTDVTNMDVIIALDTSYKSESNLETIKTEIKEFSEKFLDDSNNKLSLVTFNESSSIISGLTNNIEVIVNGVSNITSSGDVDYYNGLKEIENIIEGYTKTEDRNITAFLIVDGYSTGTKSYAQYDVLKEKYPYLNIVGISYTTEETKYINDDLKNTSDEQYIALNNNLSNVLLQQSLAPEKYQNLSLNDYIDSDFYVENNESIIVPFGNAELIDENGVQKIVWTTPESTYLSGDKTSIKIKVKLDSQYKNVENYYATNQKESITYNFKNEDSVTISSTNTPVLKNGYKVVYDANPPTGCNISSLEAETHNVYSNVIISTEKPTCDGYEFAGWKIATQGVNTINENEFIMPTNNVDIKGTWKKLSISKSMEGTIYLKPTLYNLVKSQTLGTDVENNIDYTTISSDTNGKGVYTLDSTKNNQYPVHFYRGAVTNNNVLFANFCWKIVRTTETGGVKLIYNGTPTNGTCDNTGANSLIGSIEYNTTYGGLNYVGYMYDTPKTVTMKSMDISRLASLPTSYKTSSAMAQTFYYSKTISYANGTYTLTNATQHVWADDASSLKGYYTCFSTSTTCSTVYYLDITWPTHLNSIAFSNGNTYANAVATLNQTSYIYGNDVVYSNGKYTLQNTKSSGLGNYIQDSSTLSNGYHYTCLSTSSSCTSVYYIFHFMNNTNGSKGMYYVTLSGGENVDDFLEDFESEGNTNKSSLLTQTEEWFANNMTSYQTIIEDSPYCNDRSIYDLGGWDKDTSASGHLYFSAYRRLASGTPSLTCSANDSFSKTTAVGNGKLNYSVGQITADELSLAGAAYYQQNTDFYLYGAGEDYWTMTPMNQNSDFTHIALLYNGSMIYGYYSNFPAGIRPVISVNNDAQYTSGDGSVTTPYVVEAVQ